MKPLYHPATLALSLSFCALLSACGGDQIANKTPAQWEAVQAANTPATPTLVSHDDLIHDANGDLITLGHVVYDAQPDTPPMIATPAIAVIKQNRSGQTLWQTTLPFPGDSSGSLNQLLSDESGNIYVLGEHFLLKLNAQGDTLWQRVYPGERTISMALHNNQLYITGYQTRVVNLNGDLQFSIDNKGAYPWEVAVGTDGSVMQATPQVITKHDNSGNLLWSTPSPAGVTYLSKIQSDQSGNVYVSYLIDQNGGSVVASRVIKLNNVGDQQWTRVVPDNRPSSNYYKSGNIQLHLTADGELLNISSGTKGRQLTKMDTQSGDVLWEKVYTGVGGVGESYLDTTGSLYLVGAQLPQKYDSQGNVVASYEMPASVSSNSIAVYGNQFFVGSTVRPDDVPHFYTAAFAK